MLLRDLLSALTDASLQIEVLYHIDHIAGDSFVGGFPANESHRSNPASLAHFYETSQEAMLRARIRDFGSLAPSDDPDLQVATTHALRALKERLYLLQTRGIHLAGARVYGTAASLDQFSHRYLSTVELLDSSTETRLPMWPGQE